MVKIADVNVGDEIKNEFDQIDRELLQKYAKASGDTNPIHTSDEIAERAGLKGVIAHGLFSFGFATKLFEDYLNQGEFGELIELGLTMRGMVRCGDLLITKAIVKEIKGNEVTFDVEQTTITNVEIKDDAGNVVTKYEAGERGYISEKDIKQGLVHEKEVETGTLTYRERMATHGEAVVRLNE